MFLFLPEYKKETEASRRTEGWFSPRKDFCPQKTLAVPGDNFDCCNRGFAIQRIEVKAALNILRYRGQPFNRTTPVHMSAVSGQIREDAVVEKRTG